MDLLDQEFRPVSREDRIPGMPVRTTDWTPHLIADLTSLWAEGLTTQEIGRRLGISKNAVISKAHRLHLTPRESPIKRAYPARLERLDPDPRAKQARAPRTPTVPKDEQPAGPRLATRDGSYHRMPLSKQPCKWPIGHPNQPDFKFCGDPSVRGKPYCADHCAHAFVQVPQRRAPG